MNHNRGAKPYPEKQLACFSHVAVKPVQGETASKLRNLQYDIFVLSSYPKIEIVDAQIQAKVAFPKILPDKQRVIDYFSNHFETINSLIFVFGR